MAGYIYIDNPAKRGKIGISLAVFDALATSALNNVPGISKSSAHMKRNQNIRLNRPVQTTIRHGIVHVWVAVDVVKGTNLQEATQNIQNEITNSFLIATEQIPFDVQVKVISMI
ncbi:MAG TPA: hypothetical protein GX010_01780 [Erysipelotrichaceae bacterium]|nr:hypothetical protein [Erysipelotrichaceae bacterium]